MKIQLEREELNRLELIQVKLRCANQALELGLTSKEGTPNQREFYIKNCIDAVGSYTWLETNWWREIRLKHSLDPSKTFYVEFDGGTLTDE